jgi:hypothetical protein
MIIKIILKTLVMIPALILYALKRLKKESFLFKRIAAIKKVALRLILMLFLLVITASYAKNDNPISKIITYNVVKNNTVIGTIKINKQVSKDMVIYNLESEIEAKYIFNFKIKGTEKSIYKEGILMYSSVCRSVNDKVKTNHSISLESGQYNLEAFKQMSVLHFNPITQNLITMYFNEPIGLQDVFCDNLYKMVPVKAVKNGVYKVEFSKNKYNIFYYKNGKCIKIEAFSSLFDVTLIPSES